MREESCTSIFVATKTLPQYLSFREDFANEGVPVSASYKQAPPSPKY